MRPTGANRGSPLRRSGGERRSTGSRRLTPRVIAGRAVPWVAVAAIAGLVALLLAYHVSLNPPSLHPREVVFSVAQADVLVDTARSELTSASDDPQLLKADGIENAAETLTLSQYLQSQGALAQMADAAGIPGKLISASGPYTEQLVDDSPHFEQVAKNYRLVVDIDGANPMISLYAQAPTERAAAAIVDSARAQLIRLVGTRSVPPRQSATDSRYVLRPLGMTTGGVVDPGATLRLLGITFVIVFLIGGGLLTLIRASRRRRRTPDRLEPPITELDDDRDLWPHTRRFLPWSMAVFLGIIFLVPIDAIFANGTSFPLAPTVDRISLVVIGIVWLISLARPTGSLARPRIRFTRAHVAMIVFVAIALLSVAFNGQELTIYQNLTASTKKLPVLVTFVMFFVIAASIIRPGEVRPLLKLVVGLGVLCAIGTLIERETHWNVFYAIWTSLHVPLTKPPEMDVYDDIGRLGIVGPTSEPLELATLLSLALPPAIIFASEAKGRQRLIWLVAVGIILAGALATSRKTSIVAPFVGILVLIIYRPRMMVRGLLLASIPLVLFVHVLAAGQLGSVLSELEPSHATTVNTDKVRVQRYDAVRPDVMSHLLLGEGYSSYDPTKFRFLDNEYLGLLITTGVPGMMALVAIFVSLLTLSHPLIRGPDRYRSNPALALQAMVVMIIVCSALFDSLSFGHVSYMLFLISALLVALHKPSLRGLRAGNVANAAARSSSITTPSFSSGSRPLLPVRDAAVGAHR